ncbi:DUF2017 family protein [Citricoccus sp.]|mgnify:CR=1 FL=1|uniref:DUF2017 family protein n=1 Tax=Citricoccus sp. TaxID=1978372 RepID=UPI00261430AB|nr:DUF2017 family protein [Citricoccus sp.]HRO29551.1 DUF2017 family protein [Citricoccus sp.]HRO94097.1 DUF2017 family protein [Citricoccus sp.]
MARAFKSTPKGFVADLERAERRLLRTLFQDVIQLLDRDRPGNPAAVMADRPDTEGPDGDAFWDIVAGLGPLRDGGLPGVSDGAGPGAGTVPTAAPYRPAPEDPALARLLPDGVVGDDRDDGDEGDSGAADRAAGEFRALTEDAVRRSKTQDLQRAVAALQANPVVLTEPEAVSFSRALNDVRLVLSSRLGIETEEDAERVHEVDDWSEATDVESYMALLYNFTTWLLETLMVALSTRLPD